MNLAIRTFSIACTLSLAACGSGPITLDAGDDETGDAGDVDGGDGDGGDGDGDGDGDDGGDGDGDPQGLACLDENGLVPGVLRLESSTAQAWLIDDGVEHELELEGNDWSEWMVGAAAGDTIAIARVDGEFDAQNTTVHAFSRSTREQLWSRELAGVGVQQFWAADDGWLAGTVSPYLPGQQVGFVMSQAQTIILPDHEPLAAPALGHVTAFEVNAMGARERVGWLDVGDLSWQPASPAPIDVNAAITEDNHTLEYLSLVDGEHVFVRARPGEAELIALPFEQLPEHSLYVMARSGPYRVVRHVDWNEPMAILHARVDVESGEAVLVNPEPPQGWSFFDCYERKLAVDGEGRLYYELRNDASAQIWTYDLASDTWTQLGVDVGFVDDLDVHAASQDVMLVRSMAQFQTFCPPTEWAQAPEGALVGDSMQIVRHEPAVSIVLPTYVWQVLIDRQQRCAALVGEDGWEVWALDGSDAVLDVEPGTGTWLWLD
jgi:hypothetical protein